MNQFAPLAGFALAFLLLLGALAVFLLLLWILVPFSVFAMRHQGDRQLEVLARIEARLGSLETTALAMGGPSLSPAPLGQRSPPAAEFPPSSLG